MSCYDTVQASVDWLNLIVNVLDVSSFLKDLEKIDPDFSLSSFNILDKGTYNYSSTLIHKLCPLRIAWNPVSDELPFWASEPSQSNNPFIFLSFSGDALRFFNSHNTLSDVFSFFGTVGCRASRFDIALDLFEESPVVSLLQEAVRFSVQFQKGKPTLKTKLNRTKPDNFLLHEYTDPDLENGRFYNVTIGNHASSFGMFRMYNKLFEIKYGRLKDFADDILSQKGLDRSGYWWRLEYELHKERADQVFQLLLSDLHTGDDCFMSAFVSVACTMFTPIDLQDFSNSSRNDTCEEWQDFIDELSKTIHFVQLGSVPYIPHNSLSKFEKNLLNLSGYIYAAIKYLSSSERFREEFYRSGRVKFESLNRYEYIRQGIADLEGGDL